MDNIDNLKFSNIRKKSFLYCSKLQGKCIILKQKLNKLYLFIIKNFINLIVYNHQNSLKFIARILYFPEPPKPLKENWEILKALYGKFKKLCYFNWRYLV